MMWFARQLRTPGCGDHFLPSLRRLLHALFARDLPHRVEFWRKLFGTNNNVLRAVKKERGLLCFSVGVIIPRLSLLCSLGVPESRIRTLLLQRPRLVYVKTDKIKASAEQVKRLGFSPGSPMFMLALAFVSIFSRSAVDAKLKLLRSFGWTEAELISALHKSPNILSYSKKKIHAAMQFFLNEAGCEPSYIASNPTLIGLSLEKRLMPRWYVMQCLGMKGLPRQRRSLFTVMLMTEHNFMQKCIAPYRDELPELGEAYTALHAKIATT